MGNIEKISIDYIDSPYPMGELLEVMGVSIKEDFSTVERKKLATYLADYMSGKCGSDQVSIDMKKFFLIIKGADEASYLYQYFK